MLFRTWNVLAVSALTLVSFSGCQSGKFAMPSLEMPNLAFWKSNELGAEYIEPPAHSLSPAESQLAQSQTEKPPRDLYRTNPPQRPEETPEMPDPLPGMSSYEKLAANAFAETPESSKPGNGDFAAASTAPPVSSGNQSLTPRYDTPDSNQRDFMPSAQGALQPAGVRQADNSFQPTFNNAESSPDEGRDRVVNPYARNGGTPSTMASHDSRQVGHIEYPTTRYEPFDAIDARASVQPIDTSTSRPSPLESSSATPPMEQPTVSPMELTLPKTGSPSASTGLPPALLQGQGSYAPGSVSAPMPIQPEKMTVPPSPTKSSGSGGSFQP